MKILHTADWHVGRGLGGRSRADEHEAVLAEIVDVAKRERVDLILVGGDLFDVASPTPEAERIVYSALLNLSNVARVIVIPGNHDSERRLAAIASLFELANVTIAPFITRDGPLEITTPSGETALVALLPWISQRYIVKAEQLMSLDPYELTGEFAGRVKRIVESLSEGFRDDTVNLLLGHVTIAGAELGGGERTAQTIFDYWVDATIFPADAHYVALGHLHKTQKIIGPCPIYYSGSPMQLDFSDTEIAKHVLVVEASPKTPAVVKEVPLESPRRLRTVRGTMADLESLAGTTDDVWLRVIVDEKTRVGLGDEVRQLFPTAVKVVVESPRSEEEVSIDRSAASPDELFAAYLSDKGIEDPAMMSLFTELYEECS